MSKWGELAAVTCLRPALHNEDATMFEAGKKKKKLDADSAD